MAWRRIVVNLVGDAVHGRLAESQFVERPFLTAGEYNAYVLAFAAAELGLDAELRGWLHRPSYEELAAATERRPRVGLDPRPPEPEELVVIPEGWRNPLDYARMVLSPAEVAIKIMAPPGLLGWSFQPEWRPPDVLSVSLDEVGRPESFRAMAAIGFRLVTDGQGMLRAAREAGVDCEFVGLGRPRWSLPPEVEKTVDVAGVLDNRWGPLVERVLAALPPQITVDAIGRVGNEEMRARLARARVLAWPSRVEGVATITWEARCGACVPVALDTNRYGNGLDPAHGTVLVKDVDEIAPAIVDLLEDPPRLDELAARGRHTAPAEVDWEAYLQRVGAFVAAAPREDPGRAARAEIGIALEDSIERRAAEAQARIEALAAELAAAKRDLTAATDRQEQMLQELAQRPLPEGPSRAELEGRLHAAVEAHDRAVTERDAALRELEALRRSKGERVLARVRHARRRLGG